MDIKLNLKFSKSSSNFIKLGNKFYTQIKITCNHDLKILYFNFIRFI